MLHLPNWYLIMQELPSNRNSRAQNIVLDKRRIARCFSLANAKGRRSTSANTNPTEYNELTKAIDRDFSLIMAKYASEKFKRKINYFEGVSTTGIKGIRILKYLSSNIESMTFSDVHPINGDLLKLNLAINAVGKRNSVDIAKGTRLSRSFE
jgi:tRNA G26 N,N-dimethylase Trm1